MRLTYIARLKKGAHGIGTMVPPKKWRDQGAIVIVSPTYFMNLYIINEVRLQNMTIRPCLNKYVNKEFLEFNMPKVNIEI